MNEHPERALNGRVALVTGSGRNIGREIALEFARHGAAIAVNVRSNREEGTEVQRACEALGVAAITVTADVADPAAVAGMFDEVRGALGPVSILVNNVGVRPHRPLLEISHDEWRWVLGAGLDGAFYCSQEALRDMVDEGWGRIINMSGRDGFVGRAYRAHGVTVKAGLHGLTKAIATEFGPQGVTANTIVPGAINTTRPSEWYPGFDYAERARSIPVGRVGETHEVARLAAFLVTDRGFVNGTAVHINGGQSLI